MTGASGSARRPLQAANADEEAYGEPTSSGGPSGSTCHQLWPAACEPVDERVGVGAESCRRGARLGAARSRSIVEGSSVYELPLAERLGNVPPPSTRQLPARIQIQDVRPQVDCGRYPVKVTQGDPVELAATIFKDGHDILRAVVRYRAAGSRKWLERPLEPVGNDRWRGSFEPDELGRWQYAIEAWVDRYATMLDELDRRSRPARPISPARRPRPSCSSARASSRSGTRRRPRSARRTGTARSRRARSRPTSSASGRASAPGTSSSRAPGAASRASRRSLPQLAELGFDVLYLPPIHPIGTTNRKGREQRARRASRAIPAARGRSAGPRAATTRSIPSSARTKDFDRLVARGARARGRDRARLRDPVLARPPVARAASGVVQPAPGRDAQVRGEPAQALPGHLQRQLRLGGLARALGGAPGRRPALVPRAASGPSASTTRTRSRCRSGSG